MRVFYVGIFELANQGNASLKRIRKINRQSRMGGLKTFILTDNEYLAADVKEYHKDIKKINNILEQSKNNFLSAINDCFKKNTSSRRRAKKIIKFKNKERNKNIILFCFVFAIIMLIYLLSYL